MLLLVTLMSLQPPSSGNSANFGIKLIFFSLVSFVEGEEPSLSDDQRRKELSKSPIDEAVPNTVSSFSFFVDRFDLSSFSSFISTKLETSRIRASDASRCHVWISFIKDITWSSNIVFSTFHVKKQHIPIVLKKKYSSINSPNCLSDAI